MRQEQSEPRVRVRGQLNERHDDPVHEAGHAEAEPAPNAAQHHACHDGHGTDLQHDVHPRGVDAGRIGEQDQVEPDPETGEHADGE